MKIKIGKINYEKCHIWWCFRNRAGHIEITLIGRDGFVRKIDRIPYCEFHSELAKEVLKEKYPTGEIKL